MSMPDQKKKNADDCKKYPFHGRFFLGAMKIELEVFSGSLSASSNYWPTMVSCQDVGLTADNLKSHYLGYKKVTGLGAAPGIRYRNL
jgi:hypothetical protein